MQKICQPARLLLFMLSAGLFVHLGWQTTARADSSSGQGGKEIPHCLTLTSCFQRALQVNEDVEQRRLAIENAKARYQQAVAALFPTIDFVVNQRMRDSKNFGVLGGSFDAGQIETNGVRSRSLGRTQSEGYISLRQPIFTGFREFILADAIRLQEKSSTLLLERQKELLFQEVAEAFYQILYYRKDLKLIDQTEGVLKKRISELNDFIALGRSRESEVVAVDADLSSAAVGRARTQSLLDATTEYLRFLVDEDIGNLEKSVEEVLQGNTLEELLKVSADRSDRLAADADTRSAELSAKAIRRERWPQLSLEANGYTFEDPDRTRDWEALLRLELPLFDGGAITARATEADTQTRIAESYQREISRRVELEVRQAWKQLNAAKSERDALKTLLQARQKNYELQRKDYSLGVVTNLDVLEAIRARFESERQLQEAEALVATRTAALQVAMGDVTHE